MNLSKVHKTNNPFKLAWWWIQDNAIVLIIVCMIMLILLGGWASSQPMDNSDPPTGRSGMNVYTDNLTGGQYLGTDGMGLTPRLDRDGKQIFVEPKK